MIRNVFTWLMGAVFVTGFVGCGGKAATGNRPATAKTTVTVTYKGQPVEGATVTLAPSDSSGKAASGRTGPDGVAKLTTFDPEDGAVPGSYKVAITKTEAGASSSASGGAPLSGDAYTQALAKAGGPKGTAPKEAKDLLPAKYKTPDGSGLTATIRAGEQNNLKFELSD